MSRLQSHKPLHIAWFKRAFASLYADSFSNDPSPLIRQHKTYLALLASFYFEMPFVAAFEYMLDIMLAVVAEMTLLHGHKTAKGNTLHMHGCSDILASLGVDWEKIESLSNSVLLSHFRSRIRKPQTDLALAQARHQIAHCKRALDQVSLDGPSAMTNCCHSLSDVTRQLAILRSSIEPLASRERNDAFYFAEVRDALVPFDEISYTIHFTALNQFIPTKDVLCCLASLIEVVCLRILAHLSSAAIGTRCTLDMLFGAVDTVSFDDMLSADSPLQPKRILSRSMLSNATSLLAKVMIDQSIKRRYSKHFAPVFSVSLSSWRDQLESNLSKQSRDVLHVHQVQKISKQQKHAMRARRIAYEEAVRQNMTRKRAVELAEAVEYAFLTDVCRTRIVFDDPRDQQVWDNATRQ